jgi:hypothetical protein
MIVSADRTVVVIGPDEMVAFKDELIAVYHIVGNTNTLVYSGVRGFQDLPLLAALADALDV